jgi:putative copper resistance protein D
VIDAAGGWLAIALRFVAFTATTGALGAWAFHRFVLPRVPGAPAGDARMAWQRLATHVALGCAVAVAVTALVRAQVPGAVLPPSPSDVERLFNGITGTEALHAQALAAGLAAIILVWRARPGAAWPLGAEAAIVALALIPPALAHAGTAHELRLVGYLVDAVHGGAAAAWVGGLAILTVLVARSRGADGASAAALFVGFHPVAMVAAPAVFVTGLASAWLRMGVPEGIASSTYSGLFVAKLLLAGVVGFLGAGHSKLATKRVAAISPDAVRRSLLGECAFALIVLFVTAILVGTPPIG